MGSKKESVPSYKSVEDVEFIISGSFWILYFLLLLFLLYEQQAASRFPQNTIILLLALGFVLRCIWFFAQGENIAEPSSTNFSQRILAFAVINRLATLLQFSAMSMLIVMWTRVGVKRENMKRQIVNEEAGTVKTLYEPKLVVAIYCSLLVVNAVVWVMIFVTTANTTFTNHQSTDYHFNVVLLATACFLEAVAVFFAGLVTAVKIQRYMDFLLPSRGQDNSQIAGVSGTQFTSAAYNFLTRKRKVPHLEVIWKMVIFTSVVATIMMARCVVIVYVEFFANEGHSYVVAGQVLYPLFSYQLPEFSATFIIAYAISPPQGILRRVTRRCWTKVNRRDAAITINDSVTASSANPMYRREASEELRFRTSSLRQLSPSSFLESGSIDAAAAAERSEDENGVELDGIQLSKLGELIVAATLQATHGHEVVVEPAQQQQQQPTEESKDDVIININWQARRPPDILPRVNFGIDAWQSNFKDLDAEDTEISISGF